MPKHSFANAEVLSFYYSKVFAKSLELLVKNGT